MVNERHPPCTRLPRVQRLSGTAVRSGAWLKHPRAEAWNGWRGVGEAVRFETRNSLAAYAAAGGGGYDVHGFTPTATCCRGYAALYGSLVGNVSSGELRQPRLRRSPQNHDTAGRKGLFEGWSPGEKCRLGQAAQKRVPLASKPLHTWRGRCLMPSLHFSPRGVKCPE